MKYLPPRFFTEIKFFLHHQINYSLLMLETEGKSGALPRTDSIDLLRISKYTKIYSMLVMRTALCMLLTLMVNPVGKFGRDLLRKLTLYLLAAGLTGSEEVLR